MMTELDAAIQEVTVYADRALVTRRGRIALDAGEHELRVNDLPQLLHDSLRAAGHGPAGTRILNVDITTAFHSRPPEAELLTLQTEFELLGQRQAILQARQSALNDRRQWLRALGEQSKDFAKGLAQGQMKPQDCADFFKFAAQQALQDAEGAQDLEVQLTLLGQELYAKKREIAQKQQHSLPDRQAAVVLVALAEAGDFELELSYLVMGASWHPQYDVRVEMNDEQSGGEVEVTYTGVVQQATGENWEHVGLALSTARPSLAAVPPELNPWYLNIYTPPPPVPAPQYRMAHKAMSMPMAAQATRHMGGASGADGYGEVALDVVDELKETSALSEPMRAEIATAAVEHSGTAYVFRAGRSVDIPSDNSPHKTTIARDSLPCTFDYVSAPAIEENIHLRATITNTTERALLQGDASIFLSGEYVGTTQVKLTAPTEQFKIFLGIDDAIKVKRELIERGVDRGNLLQGDMRRITYAYRITVHNYAAAPRKIVVRDHLPVPQHERIKVKSQSIQPTPAERTKLELLTWEFTLPADGEQKIEYRFVVEHPQGVQMVGL